MGGAAPSAKRQAAVPKPFQLGGKRQVGQRQAADASAIMLFFGQKTAIDSSTPTAIGSSTPTAIVA